MPKPVMTIPFGRIERSFDLASYWLGAKWCPAVDRKSKAAGSGYTIRVFKSETRNGANVTITYDYFELGSDGTVLVAPRGYARDFKPGRITGLDEALTRYTKPAPDARRINVGL